MEPNLEVNLLELKIKHLKNNRMTVYYGKCSQNNCTKNYTGETGGFVVEQVIEHNRRDLESHIFKLAVEKNHKPSRIGEFRFYR